MSRLTICFVLCCIYLKCSAGRVNENAKSDVKVMTIEELSASYQMMKPHLNEMQIKIDDLEQKLLIQDEIIKTQNEKLGQQGEELDIVQRELQEIKGATSASKLTEPNDEVVNTKTSEISGKPKAHELLDTVIPEKTRADTSKIQGIKKRQQGETVAFTAYLGKDLTNLGPNQVILFDGVELNEGNAYNPHTGIFTVPMDGVYLFSFSLEDWRGHRLWFKLVVDGQLKSGAVIGPSVPGNLQGSNVVILRMTAGQTVWVAIHESDSGDSVQGSANIRASTFSGVFLYP